MPEHITISATEPIIRYLASGTQTIYSFPFPIFKSDDLEIRIDGAIQNSAYNVDGAGLSDGGTVTFDNAPSADTIITLQRKLPLERVTDFLEGGDFSAKALNNELDYLTASIQQVDRENRTMLRYSDDEEVGETKLPSKSQRSGRALGFDGNGNPIAVSLEGSMAAPDFTASGTGSITRTSHDKFSDYISVKDFGAVGDGLTDDTLAIQQALTAHQSVFVPTGTYLITNTITLTQSQNLIGAGQSSIIKANDSSFNAIEITHSYAYMGNLRIENGDIGIKLYGKSNPCVQNTIENVTIWQSQTGIQLDGYQNGLNPCYWNNFDHVLVAQPFVHGIHLMRSGAGDTPNANRFHQTRVYSLGATTSGAGFYVEEGSFNNSFVDCEANVNGSSAQACFHIGAGSNKTLLVNVYAESNNGVPNVRLDNGSIETVIMNLLSASDGAAIWDLSGGQYEAFNAGYPYKNKLRRTSIEDLTATLIRYDTEYIDTAGTHNVNADLSMHIISAINGAIEMVLPNATDAVGKEMTFKKTDTSGNLVTITEDGGGGPDGTALQLGGQGDYATVISNGAEWFVKSSNRLAGNTRFYDGTGTYDIDMAVDVYLLSSFGGALEARLPPANAAESIGRIITIKKTDSSSNTVTISEQGGSGPDNYDQPLTSQFQAMTVVSNGANWYILSKFN